MTEKRELHYRYILAFLLLGLVLLISLAYYNVPDLVDKFLFALTLSSLLLAILAIFYTIVAANKQDLQLSKIVETNSELGTATAEIKSAAEEIRSFARYAPEQFNALTKKIEEVGLSFEKIEPEELSQESGQEAEDYKIHITDRQFHGMFVNLYFSAMMVLYLFQRSYNQGKNINIEIIERLNIDPLEYTLGVLNAISSTGLISFKLFEGVIIPTDCAEVLSNNIHEALSRVIDAVKDNDSVERIKDRMAIIEEYTA